MSCTPNLTPIVEQDEYWSTQRVRNSHTMVWAFCLVGDRNDLVAIWQGRVRHGYMVARHIWP